MTRKRFVKVLMGYGISRNDAREEAYELLDRNERRMKKNKDTAHWKRTSELNLWYEIKPEKMESYKELATWFYININRKLLVPKRHHIYIR